MTRFPWRAAVLRLGFAAICVAAGLVRGPAFADVSRDLKPDAKGAETAKELVLGEYKLARDAVVDGDTVRVEGLDETLRLLCLDAEETFKNLADRREAVSDFETYLERHSAGEGEMPAKFATFLGEEAKEFAKKFFEGLTTIRLEYDTLKRKRGYYNRHLVYIFAAPKGEKAEKNYNVELVRAGLSPYSMKYGHSTRFRKEFEEAELEAKASRLGIWADKPRGYRDYDVRIAWWKERAEQMERFAGKLADFTNPVDVADDDAGERLKKLVGQEVTLFASVGERDSVFPDEKYPRVMLSYRSGSDIKITFPDRDAFDDAAPADMKGYLVIATGVLREEKNGFALRLTAESTFRKA